MHNYYLYVAHPSPDLSHCQHFRENPHIFRYSAELRDDLLLIQKPYDGRGAVFSSTELFSSRVQLATHALQLLSNVSDLKLVRKWGTAHRLGPENGGSSIRVISGKSGAERNIRVRNGTIDQFPKMAFSSTHKNGAARSLSETQSNQKSGTPLLFTGVSHNFAPLCDIHRRRLNVAEKEGFEPSNRL